MGLDGRFLIVCPDDVAQALGAAGCGAQMRNDVSHIPPGVDTTYILQACPADEERIKREVSLRGVRALSISYDISPALAIDEGRCLSSAMEGERTATYAIVSNPRTGSTFLCDLLEQAGLGRPKEHLRDDGIGYLLREGRDSKKIFERLMSLGGQNGVFGTKFISHFLKTGFTDKDAVSVFFRWLKETHGCAFFYLKRDFIDCAVSYYVARKTNFWSTKQQVGRVDLKSLFASITYDPVSLVRLYRDFVDWDIFVRDVLNAVPGPHRVLEYEAVTADPVAHVGIVAESLGADVKTFTPMLDLDKAPKKLSALFPQIAEIAERFHHDIETGAIGID